MFVCNRSFLVMVSAWPEMLSFDNERVRIQICIVIVSTN